MLRGSRLAALFIATLCLFSSAHAQVGYAVTSTGQLSFERILTDISGFFALFSKQRAQNYFEFWDAVLNRRNRDARPLAAAGKR